MAQLWCTGPAHCYVASQNQNPASALYLGTADSQPQIDVRTAYEPVFNDLGGNKIPFDMSYEGQDALIEYRLTRWTDSVMQAVVDQPNAGYALNNVAVENPGTTIPGDIGTLMLTEGQAMTIFVVFPYFTKPAFSGGAGNGAMVPGYRFPASLLVGETFTKSGTKSREVYLAWNALRLYEPTVTNAYGYGAFTLYDFNIIGLPAPG